MMNKKLLVSLCFLLAVFASCTFESSDNGSLDGYWHLERIDTISTGGVCDLSSGKIFWNIQGKLLQLNDDDAYYFFRFRQTSDSLVLHTPYINLFGQGLGQGQDAVLKDSARLQKYGIEDLEVHYKKEELNGSKMILRSRRLRLMFRRF